MRRIQVTPSSRRGKSAAVLFAATVGSMGLLAPAQATNNTFLNTTSTGSWAATGNWIAGRVPTTGDVAIVPLVLNSPQQANLDYDYSATAPPDAVRVDGTAATAAVLSQSANNLLTATGTIGDLGRGTFNQSGGTATFGSLTLGNQATGQGVINNGGVGQITINGTGSSALYIGFAQGSSGAISAGASLDTSAVPAHVGYSGTGNLSVGGTVLAGTMTAGTNATGSGTITLNNSSTLGVANTLTIGALGSGTLTQLGGTLLINNQLILSSSGGSGTYNFSGGSLNSTGLVNNGTINQTGGSASVAATTGTGSLTVGGGAAAAALNTTSFAQGTVAISNNGSIILPQTSPRAVNTATNFSIVGNGQLNLTNNDLLLSRSGSPPANVRQYVINGFAGGAWNGTGGINSTTVAKFNATSTHLAALGYADGADGIATGLAADKVLVRYVYSGDANLDGRVNTLDLGAWKDGVGTVTGGKWTQGDFDYSGRVNTIDLGIWKTNVGQFLPTLPAAGLTSALATSSVKSAPALALSAATTLTSGSLQGSTPAALTSGQVELDINTTTGNIKLQVNNLAMGSYEVDSDASHLIPANFLHPLTTAVAGWDNYKFPETIAEYTTKQGGDLISGTFDLGNIWQVGSPHDLQLVVLDGSNNRLSPSNTFVVYSTPEPTVIGFLGLGAIGLLARRRTRRAT